jgi:hypothetical protein
MVGLGSITLNHSCLVENDARVVRLQQNLEWGRLSIESCELEFGKEFPMLAIHEYTRGKLSFENLVVSVTFYERAL